MTDIASPKLHDFSNITSVVQEEFVAVDKLIYSELGSNVPLIQEVGHYITRSGGKRLRPLLTLLSASACGYSGNHHIHVAAITELLHTATLLHDDVVDESELRRGKATVNALWNNSAAILVGDFLVSRSFQMIVDIADIRLMKILADAANCISEGEVLQMMNAKNPDISETDYLKVINYKTGKMFEVAAQVGPILAESSHAIETAMTRYAQHLGTAFQLIDDYLDYSSDSATLGKNIGDDLAEGKPTLPLIYAIQHSSTIERDLLKNIIRNGDVTKIDEVMNILDSSGAMEYTLRMAQTHCEQSIEALKILDSSRYSQALEQLALFSIQRSY